MTVFEFLLALYAIVAGLGVSLLVTSVGQLIEARDRVRLYWVHSCWIALTFVGHVVSWFTIWRFHEHAPWTVLQADAPGIVDDGLLRKWPRPAADIHKHYGYAFQWFGLCALMSVLYVWFQLIRPRLSGHESKRSV